MNPIVARFQDGRVLKGFTNDFLAAKDHFHMTLQDQAPGAKPMEIRVADLKGLFFVKTFQGDPSHNRVNDPALVTFGAGRRIRVVFKDGETLVGTTQGYDKSRPGFFVVPADPATNNERCFIVAAATREVSFLP